MNPKKNKKFDCEARKLSRGLKKPKPRVVSKPAPSRKNQLLLDNFLQVSADSDRQKEGQTDSPLEAKDLDKD